MKALYSWGIVGKQKTRYLNFTTSLKGITCIMQTDINCADSVTLPYPGDRTTVSNNIPLSITKQSMSRVACSHSHSVYLKRNRGKMSCS